MERRKFLFLFIGSAVCLGPIIFGCLFGIPKSNKETAPENAIENSTNQPQAYSNLYFPVNRSDIALTTYMSGNGTTLHDVVIIGAGLSGLSAALKLCQEMPDLDIVLLEASNMPGGRIFSTHMSNTSYIEVGARWLIGSDQNALQALANLAHVHRASERRVTRVQILRNMFYLSICTNITVSESGICTQSADEFDDVMLGGAHKMVEYLVTLLGETNCHLSIQFNTKVSNITTTDSIASVLTENGRVYPASYIISSIPAGVLQESLVSFQPGLPHVIHQAIQNLHVMKISVIHVALSESIPRMTEPYYSIEVDQEGDKHLDVVNLMSFTGDNLLALYANHRLSADLEKISDAAIIRMISTQLQRAFGTAPSISNFLVSHWGLHPYVRGAYTTLSDCSTPQDRATLREPIGGRLVFTGEWVASVSPGTLTGAFLSGIESALRILQAFDDETCTSTMEDC